MQPVRDSRPEELLLNYGRKIHDKHERLRQEYQQIQENFDFKPKINKKSQAMQMDRSIYGEENVETSSAGGDDTSILSRDRFAELYNDGMKKKMRQ